MTLDEEPAWALPASLRERLRELRHDLHRHPELGATEHRTKDVVRRFLGDCGLEAIDCTATGLFVDFESRRRDGPKVALRADLDALPMTEETPLSYRSVHEGVAHKCGHDGHTAILCGVAATLADGASELRGDVRLIFQPDEEGHCGGGAVPMIEAGVLRGVDEIFGLHNWPGFPVGEVRVAPGPVMASVEDFEILLEGVGGHAAEPQNACDPVLAGSNLVQALSSLGTRERGLAGGAVVQITQFHGGEVDNVIPAHAKLRGTIRTVDPLAAGRLRGRIAETATAICGAFGVTPIVRTLRGYPVLMNSDSCASRVRQAATSLLGSDRVSTEGLPLAASEDFAYFSEKVPGAYFFLGAGDPVGATPGCHHPDFDFDDRLLDLGVTLFVDLVRESSAS
ncbi:MAG: M20 family metallopeptidase [Planctomycetota bacterium]